MESMVTVVFTTIANRTNYTRTLPFRNSPDRLAADIHMIARSIISDSVIWKDGLKTKVNPDGTFEINDGALGVGTWKEIV